MNYCKSGQIVICDGTNDLVTVLGSCVSVCFRSCCGTVGGMTHFNLPYPLARERPNDAYGEYAIKNLIRSALQLGLSESALQFGVYGGSNRANTLYPAGKLNAEYAFEYLRSHGYKVTDSHVGGDFGRRLIMSRVTKNCYVQKLTMPLGEGIW